MLSDDALFDKWNQSVGTLLYHLESRDFPCYLIEAINRIVAVEAVMVTLERRNAMPILLFDHGIPKGQRTLFVDAYFSGAYLLDPFCLAYGEEIKPGFYHLSEVAPDDFYQSDYWRTYYLNTSLIDDAFFIIEPKEGVRLSIALGRYGDHQQFSSDELRLLRLVNPVVQGATQKYWHFIEENKVQENKLQEEKAQENKVPPGSDQVPMKDQVEAAFNNFGSSVLTRREREVALLLLRGHSSKSAAQKLGISPDTVQMHRKKMYLKLDIGSHSELFSLFIQALTSVSDSDADPLTSYINRVQK